jgi:serine/threonine protein phosphatase PrpC
MRSQLLIPVTVDQDQQRGSLEKNAPLEDCWSEATITIPGGPKFHLSAVADGGGSRSPAVAAKLALDTVFGTCRRGAGGSIGDLLQSSLVEANQTVYQQCKGVDYVGMTLVATTDDRLYIGQAGQCTRAYAIHNDQSIVEFPLGSDKCLGDSPGQPDILLEESRIKRGERIVICSDGLFNPPGDDSLNAGVKAKLLEALKVVGKYDDLRGSARHLSSVAKGMDVRDDITVVVVGLGRKPVPVSKMRLVWYGIAAATVVLFSAAVLVGNSNRQAPRPQDLGLAVLRAGDTCVIDAGLDSTKCVPLQQYYTIGPGKILGVLPGPSAELTLKTFDPEANSSQEIPGVNLYLSPQSQVTLSTLDLAHIVNNQPADAKLLNLTEITLSRGQLLIVSDGGRKYVVFNPPLTKSKTTSITLEADEAGALGVALQDSSLAAYCFRGLCDYALSGGKAIPLPSPGKATIDTTNSTVLSADQSISASDRAAWSAICGGAQQGQCLPTP